MDQDGQVIDRIEGYALSADMALMAYLEREAVRSPMEYICLSALVQRQWLPLFYFISLAGRETEAAMAALEGTQAVYRVSKRMLLARLRGQRTAYSEPGGAILQVVEALRAGQIDDLRERFTNFQIVHGVQGLPADAQPDDELFDLLKEIFLDAKGNANVRCGVCRAAARLDEIEAR